MGSFEQFLLSECRLRAKTSLNSLLWRSLNLLGSLPKFKRRLSRIDQPLHFRRFNSLQQNFSGMFSQFSWFYVYRA